MSQWYYSKDGQAHGPFEYEKLVGLLQAGEVGHLDQVFEVGSTEWKVVSNCPDLVQHLKKDEPEPPPPNENSENTEWVVLRKAKGDDGMKYKQKGPYTKTQVINLLDSGEVIFTDYAWKSGMDSWVPIHKLEPFKTPLPSSVPVDKKVYQSKEQLLEETKTELKTNQTSLTELIEIEKYQKEKTQFVNMAELRKQWEQEDTAVDTEIREPAREEKGDAGQLWSLEPPTDGGTAAPKRSKRKRKGRLAAAAPAPAAEPIEVDEAFPEVTDTEIREAPPVKKKRKRSRRASAPAPETPAVPSHRFESPLPWVIAGATLVVAGIFVVFSFFGGEEAGEDMENIAAVDEALQQIESSPETAENQADQMRRLQEKIQALETEKKERARYQSPRKRKRKNARKASKTATAPGLIADYKPKTSKVESVAPRAKAKSKKRRSKRAPARRRKITGTGLKVKGSFRVRSYYLQRDRKALFYSSLDSEKLVLELEANYKKFRSKPSEWKKFYRSWKGRLRGSMPSIIKTYPVRGQQYGYPKELAAYKKDHKLLKGYGELHNAKVLGLRVPASPGKNLRETFSNYQTMAQALGR